MAEHSPSILKRSGLPDLAYHYTEAATARKNMPVVMFCGGYRSDMTGTKATFLEQKCRESGLAYVRFDYRGHGQSGGVFEKATIGQWKQDTLDILEHVGSAQCVLAGSSMGGWMALLAALERPALIKGVVGIAAAPDFTEDLYRRLSQDQKHTLMTKGHVHIPNDYSDEPYVFAQDFYEEARSHLLLRKTHKVTFPIHLIQGMQDQDVPWEKTRDIEKSFTGDQFDITYIEDGDHRLSRPEDLEVILRGVQSLL